MSTIQKLLEDAIHAENRRKGTIGLQVQSRTLGVNYGYTLLSPYPIFGKARRSQRLCAKMVSRHLVLCGGCNRGRVPQRDKDGRKVGNWSNWKKHADCEGGGLRYNKRYGRCGAGLSWK